MVFNSRVSILNRSLFLPNRDDSLIIEVNDARLLIPVWFPICMSLRFVHMWSGLRAMLLGLSWMFFVCSSCSFKNIALAWFWLVLFYLFGQTLSHAWLINNLVFICINNMILMAFNSRVLVLNSFWQKSWCLSGN
jgi:hypothetical protein